MIRVVHSTPVWLPQSHTWIWGQVRCLPPDRVEPLVVCERTEHLDQFAVPRLACLADAPRLRAMWDKGLRKLGVRRHTGFLVQQIRRAGAQILHSHFGSQGWTDSGAARRAAVRHVVSFYGADASQLPTVEPAWRTRYAGLFRTCARVLCEGSHMARCLAALGCPNEKIRVCHLGVDLERIPFLPRTRRPGEPLRILIASTFREKKGIPLALEAVAVLRRTTPAEVTVIGDATHEIASQKEGRRIRQTVADCGLQGAVRFLGFRTYPEFMDEAYRNHVFMAASVTAGDGDAEGGAPVALIEMAASGMPVVSTWHCDIPEIVASGVSGLLAEERDVRGLAQHLEWLATHTDQWAVMAAAARRHIENEYCARRQGERLADIYAELAWIAADRCGRPGQSATNHCELDPAC